ncbi:MAG TPA: VWA domain-containing protein [Hyphomicrobiaceae bacterium]
MQKLRRGLNAAALAAGVWLGGAGAPAAADSGALMIIVDGSGSMAGLIERNARQSKIALVRDSLLEALAQVGPQTRIGLAAFGHRNGGCSDVEIMRPPERPDVERVMAPLARLKPRGRGAITLALREAAKQLPEGASPRSLVLIHDGLDNCQQDVCAAAAELGAAGIVTHVVSLGLTPDDLAKMACLPKATGGRHFKVDASDQVSGAIGEAVRLASGELTAVGLAPGAPMAQWATSVVPPAPARASRPAALQLAALAAPGTEPLAVPLHWTVAREDDPDAVLFDAWAANPQVSVAPGTYVVTVGSDLVSAHQSVTVREGRPTPAPIVLGAGVVRVRVAAQKTNAALPDAIITISAADGTPVAVFKAAEAAALLPAGRFRISAELGLVRDEQTVTMVEGRPAFVDLALNVGRLQLIAAGRDGPTPAEGALFIVLEDDPPRGRREVARSAASQAEFALPPGTYYIIARQGTVEARERLEIGSGDVVRRTLTAATGRLGLSAEAPRRAELVAGGGQ